MSGGKESFIAWHRNARGYRFEALSDGLPVFGTCVGPVAMLALRSGCCKVFVCVCGVKDGIEQSVVSDAVLRW